MALLMRCIDVDGASVLTLAIDLRLHRMQDNQIYIARVFVASKTKQMRIS